ncbi:MAG: ATP-binding protein [Longimicrobiales bacterium]|nr:ATP-binding protein [Longimicrobiales bacterium]
MLLHPPVGWGTFLAVAAAAELYAVVGFLVLKRYFARTQRVHLGTVFLVADLAVFSLVVYATGAHASWLWPIYLLRVADQMWIGRRRAAWMALAGMGFFLALMLWVGLVERQPVEWSGVFLKLSVLGAMGAYLVMISGLPWDLQGRTRAAREMILRLEAQSLALDQERRRAEDASRAKSEFLARMSHELKTPLNAVVGFTNLLMRPGEVPLGTRERTYLTRIRDNGMHLLALINDVLDISRIDEGTMDIRVGQVNLEDLVRGTLAQLEGRLSGSGVRLSVAFPRALGPLLADDARMRQILINLVGNAIKFTREGWIRVEVSADPDTGAPHALRVVDSGIGIPSERLETIFGAFEQVDGSPSRKFGGTGLGLAISRALCRLQGFDLTVESQLGKGSTFTVHFRPASPPRPE